MNRVGHGEFGDTGGRWNPHDTPHESRRPGCTFTARAARVTEGSGTGRVLGALAARKGYNSGGGGVAYSSAARVLPRGAIWLGDFGGEAACFSRNCAIGPCDIELKAKTAFSLVRGSA